MKPHIFISHCHKDNKKYLNGLAETSKQFNSARSLPDISIWWDGKISAGQKFNFRK